MRMTIAEADRQRRLFLRESVGPLSGGTRVRVVRASDDWLALTVAAPIGVHIEKGRRLIRKDAHVTVSADQLVIGRCRS